VASGDATTCIRGHRANGSGFREADLCCAGAVGLVPGAGQMRAAQGNAKPPHAVARVARRGSPAAGLPRTSHGGAPGGGLARLRHLFGGWHDPIPALLDAADPDTVLHHDLYELPPLKAYTRGTVVLAGDAAHAMTPNLGQGACQALEDAVVLGNVLASGEGPTAYDRQQRRRTQMITCRSRRIGAVGQWASPAAVTLRNTALRLLPPSSFARSLAPVLDWPPERHGRAGSGRRHRTDGFWPGADGDHEPSRMKG